MALGLAVLAPEFVTGPSTSDSLRYNIVWMDQWRDAVAMGDLYPRWLPRSWDELGSPTFYFYPPLFFWVAAALDAVTLWSLSTGALLTLTSGLLLGASGLTMHGWLRAQVAPRIALVGAATYMLAPYHLYDIYARGALAESCAYAALPLVLHALSQVRDRGFAAVPMIALSYAALILSHLPVAVLASVLLLPVFALFQTGVHARTLLCAGVGGVLGLSLAAVYLLPAVSLTPYILAEAFSGSFYRPESWFFWRPGVWFNPVMWVVGPAWLGALLLAGASALTSSRGPAGKPAVFWSAATVAMLLLIAGIPSLFWQLPIVSQVQFPWRLMVLAEFGVITALALAWPRPRGRLLLAGAVPIGGALAITLLLVVQRMEASWHRSNEDIDTIRAIYRDAPEYLPAGSALPLGKDGLPDPSLVALPRRPEVQAETSSRLTVTPLPRSALAIRVESAKPVDIVVRRFSFPHWRVHDGRGRAVFWSATSDRLVGWRAPAGRSEFRLSSGRAPGEAHAIGVTAASLMIVLVLAIMSWTRARHVYRSGVEAAS